MLDVLLETRQMIIENFQISMRALRLLMGYTIAELAECVGVTRQTINNLETRKSKMSTVQFLALAAVVDNYISLNKEMYQAIEAILDGNGKKMSDDYETSFSRFSLLRRWFLLFDGDLSGGITVSQGDVFSPNGEKIKKLVRGYKIFLDDTVLCQKQSETFFVLLGEQLVHENEKLIIPFRAIQRIQEQVQNTAKSQNAVQGLKLINWLQQKKVAEIRGEESDSNLRDTILSVFAKFRSSHRLCLITQDGYFAQEVLRLNQSKERRGFDVIAGYLNDSGNLALYPPQDPSDPWSDLSPKIRKISI